MLIPAAGLIGLGYPSLLRRGLDEGANPCHRCTSNRFSRLGLRPVITQAVTQHIPNQGEHLIRYYGRYSNKTRGRRAKQADQNENNQPQPGANTRPANPEARKRWAMLIQRVYHADPLRCPRCGGAMKIIAFIEARHGQLVRQILEHCGLWQDPPTPVANAPPRSPPRPRRRSRAAAPRCPLPQADAGVRYEVDPEYLEHARHEAHDEQDQPELPWDA